MPDLVLGWYDWVVAFDHVDRRALLISTGLPATACEQLKRSESRADRVLKLLEGDTPIQGSHSVERLLRCGELAPSFPLDHYEAVLSNFTAKGFRQAIRRGINYTHAGDCFQVNLAQRLLAPFRDNPVHLFQRLRRRNPSQFAGYFDLGAYVVASASPVNFAIVSATPT